jgi:hypothetical protein
MDALEHVLRITRLWSWKFSQLSFEPVSCSEYAYFWRPDESLLISPLCLTNSSNTSRENDPALYIWLEDKKLEPSQTFLSRNSQRTLVYSNKERSLTTPNLSILSAMHLIASLDGAVTSTLSPLDTNISMSATIVWVFPVPGGPWMTERYWLSIESMASF